MYPKEMISIIKTFYINNDYSIREVANIFNISKSSVHRYINFDITTNHDNTHVKKISKCTDTHNHIKNMIITNPLITAKTIKQQLKSYFNKDISISGVYLHIKQLGLTQKKVSKKVCRNKVLLTHQRKQFKNIIKYIDYNDIICIDETYFSSDISHNYGWSPKGERITCYSNRKSIKKYSMLMAISNNKIIAFKIYNTNVNSAIYYDFLKDQILPTIKNKYILMDNIPFHKTNKITELIANSINK